MAPTWPSGTSTNTCENVSSSRLMLPWIRVDTSYVTGGKFGFMDYEDVPEKAVKSPERSKTKQKLMRPPGVIGGYSPLQKRSYMDHRRNSARAA